MQLKLRADVIADGARRQVALAEIAQTEEVRAVHRALEQLYRTQLVAMELAERLMAERDAD